MDPAALVANVGDVALIGRPVPRVQRELTGLVDAGKESAEGPILTATRLAHDFLLPIGVCNRLITSEKLARWLGGTSFAACTNLTAI
jgi:hypothetical protein